MSQALDPKVGHYASYYNDVFFHSPYKEPEIS